MCTVTFIPQKENDFILTSNRDERAARSPQNITIQESEKTTLIFPRDTAAGGTWIATSTANKVVCLLNGAFTWHKHEPPYKRSRGLMVLDFFEYKSAKEFYSSYDFEGMEPFTMIIYDNGILLELRWDEEHLHQKDLDVNQKHIWSSATLYEEAVIAKREKWFSDWLENRVDFSLEAILNFHQTAGDGDPENDVIMNRQGIVQTVSITNIIKEEGSINLLYHDLLNEQLKQTKIKVQSEMVGSH